MTTLTCPAKINLFLAIKSRYSSGYHEIETVLARVPELHDLIHIEPAEKFSFHCQTLPSEGNTVVKAIKLLEQETNTPLPYKITLEKHIPIQSGLGGASSDAAAILLHFNKSLNIPKARLMELAAQIGMDVPFFVSGHEVALGTHYGEIITPLPNLPASLKIQIHPGPKISTAEAYAAWQTRSEAECPSPAKLIAALKSGDTKAIIASLHNDFTSSSSPETTLSGSGGASFVVHELDNSRTKTPTSKAKSQS